MKSGQLENARIRVEEVIRQEKLLQAYATLETYLLLLQTRAAVLKKEKEPPQDMLEAICTLLFCAPRVQHDLDEIPVIAEILMAKFRNAFIKLFEDKDFAKNVSNEATAFYYSVNTNVVNWLSVSPADPQPKIDKLEEIAQKFNASFDKAAEEKAVMPVTNNIRLSHKPPTLPSVYQSSVMGDMGDGRSEADIPGPSKVMPLPPSHVYAGATAPCQADPRCTTVPDTWQGQEWGPIKPSPPQHDRGYDFPQKIVTTGGCGQTEAEDGVWGDGPEIEGKGYIENSESEGYFDDQDSALGYGPVRSRGGSEDEGRRAVDSSLAAKLDLLKRM